MNISLKSNTRLVSTCCATLIAVSLSTVILFPVANAADSHKFKEVEPGLLRGGFPRGKSLNQLNQLGVRTIVDLMDEENVESKQLAEQLGMKYVKIPLRRTKPIPEESIKTFLSTVEDSANRPVYVHCRSGRDRTGAMLAIYRIDAENWSLAEANAEMKKHGFNKMFRHLSKSVADFSQNKHSAAKPVPPHTVH